MERMNKYGEAERWYRNGLDHDQDSVKLNYSLGRVLILFRKNYDGAEVLQISLAIYTMQ